MPSRAAIPLLPWLAICIAICPIGSGADLVDSIREKYSRVLRTVAEDLEWRYDNLEGMMTPEACGCSYHACGNEYPEGRCVDVGQEDFTSPAARAVEAILGCREGGSCGHRKLNLELTGVYTPSNVINEDPNLSPRIVEDICMTQGMEGIFMSVNNYTGDYVPQMYFASARSGVLRKWPLVPTRRLADKSCDQYDPRAQAWYTAATSEPKNVVIIVQATSTMSQPFHQGAGRDSKSRWEVATATVRGVLATLDRSSDFVSVVVFHSQAESLRGGTLVKATKENQEAVMSALNTVNLSAGADNKAAFDAAFDLFDNTFRMGEYLTNCQNIIIHIGDGQDCTVNGNRPCSLAESAGGDRLHDGVLMNLNAVEARQKQLELISSRAAIFTLTVEGGEDSLARQLACQNGGVWFQLDGRGEPLNNMEAYFQYLAFSMEPRERGLMPPAIFTPLRMEFVGLSTVTNAALPVFVRPKCPDGSLSRGKLLLGVVVKDVTLSQLKADGMTEASVKAMITENLGSVRACDESYKYDRCKMQAIRGTEAECTSRVWEQSASNVCHRFMNRHYVLGTQPTQFGIAEEECRTMGGRLAELTLEDGEDQQHFLASIVPPDGAWIGLQPIKNTWTWIGSMRKAERGELERMWFLEPSKVGNCRGGFADPRGTLRNIGARTCGERMAFVCEFDAATDALPKICKGAVAVVGPEVLRNETAEGCSGCRGHSASSTAKPDEERGREVICYFGEPKATGELACCTPEEYQEICPARVRAEAKADDAVSEASQGTIAGSTDQIIPPFLAPIAVAASLIALALGLLAVEWRTPGTLRAMYDKVTRRARHVHDIEFQDVASPKSRQTPKLLELAGSPFEPKLLDRNRLSVLEGGWQLSGAHGDIKEGIWLDENRVQHRVAIKSPKYSELDKHREAIARELRVLATVPGHPNIVTVVGFCLTDGPLIVEEFMATNLEAVLCGADQGLTYDQIMRISLDVARGLDHLHEHGVTHYDIKPSNILMDGEFNAKLADFSCSELKLASSMSLAVRGSAGYIAPEIVEKGLYSRRGGPGRHFPTDKVDVYSFGKVMLECVTGSLNPENAAAGRICHGPLWELVRACVSGCPKERPGCKQIVERLEGMVKDEGGWEPGWKARRPMQEISQAS